MKWKPKDVIGLVVIIILGALIALGRDGLLTNAFMGVVVVYHGADVVMRARKGG
jgi:hypothetical protein